MPNIPGPKWGNQTLGTKGGVVTWSLEGAGAFLSAFGLNTTSVTGESFLSYSFEAIIRDAFKEWSKYGNIEFLQLADSRSLPGSSAEADIRIYFAEIPGNTIGMAFLPDYSIGQKAGDIVFDTWNRFNIDPTTFKTTVLHEIGHALGLGHVNLPSIMTPSLSTTSTLQADDKLGIQQIYGEQDNTPSVYQISGSGTFKMVSRQANITVQGKYFDNNIIGTEQRDKINGGGGEDTIIGNAGNDYLFGSLDNDTVSGGAGEDTVIGGSGADSLNGGEGQDILIGGAGADAMNGGGDFDTADYSGSASGFVLDMQNAAAGTGDAAGDTLVSIEKIIGSLMDDVILGDGNANRLIGRNGNDHLSGLGGEDWLKGKFGNDTIDGGAGNDSIEGNTGQDLLLGGDGNDTIRGNRSNDTLEGGDGDDRLRSGSQNDVLDGGAGDDRLRGGAQADTFIFADGHGNDIIEDFKVASLKEAIDLSAVTGMDSFADVRAAAVNVSNGVLINTGVGDSILLWNVSLGQLSADEFLF